MDGFCFGSNLQILKPKPLLIPIVPIKSTLEQCWFSGDVPTGRKYNYTCSITMEYGTGDRRVDLRPSPVGCALTLD